ncbi:hypothetical protein ABPG75_003576 [Micractinium tetrahymenae]
MAAASAEAMASIQGEGAVPFQPLRTAAAWTAASAAAEQQEWLTVLSPVEVAEVLAATDYALSTGKPIQDLTAADFPLPTLGPKLAAMRRSCLHGRGFHLLRGFPVDELGRQEVVAAFFGLGTHWGNARSQNAKGSRGGPREGPGVGPWRQRRACLPDKCCTAMARGHMRSGGADVPERGQVGGLSRWASSVSIYNRLL